MSIIEIKNVKEMIERQTLDITQEHDNTESFVKHIEITTEENEKICFSFISTKQEFLRIKKIRI